MLTNKVPDGSVYVSTYKIYEHTYRKFAGSHRVLPPQWTIGQENLIALALSTSLRPRTIMRGGQRATPMN